MGSKKRSVALLLALLFAVTFVISGCGQKPAASEPGKSESPAQSQKPAESQKPEEQPAESQAPVEEITQYSEAPVLAEKVKAGKLPPVEERLPKEPLIYTAGTEVPIEDMPQIEIGKYGGTLRVINPGSPGGGENWAISREPLLNQPGFGKPGEKPVGNVLKDFEISDEGKVFTFYMREGMKWSDGHPLTTEDVRYAYEDVLLNEELTPTFPTWLKNADGTPCEIKILDEYTFQIIFKESYALFPYTLSLHWQTWDSGPLIQPAHYMKQFHIKYTPLEDLKPLLAKNELGDTEWYRLHSLYSWGGGGIAETRVGCPTLSAYVLEEMPSAQVGILRRNPYYFKVDAKGQQLPYIDEMRCDTVTSVDMLPMKIMGGEVDLARQAVSINEVALYKENETKGGYTVKLLKFHCPIPITFNYSNPDTEWTKIILDNRFRTALNLAINRDEIIDAVYNGFASNSRITPAEYDIGKANALLDEMGLDRKDSEGYRLRPDGKRMELIVETSAPSTDFIPLIELLVENWKDIGIYARLNQIDSTLLSTRSQANETQVIVSSWMDLPVAQGNPYMLDWVLLNDRYKVSEGYRQWYTTLGEQGVEPTEELKQIFTLYDKMKRSTDINQIGTYMAEWEKAMHDSLFLIVPVEDIMIPLIVNSKIGNVPESGYQIMANFAGEILYYKE